MPLPLLFDSMSFMHAPTEDRLCVVPSCIMSCASLILPEEKDSLTDSFLFSNLLVSSNRSLRFKKMLELLFLYGFCCWGLLDSISLLLLLTSRRLAVARLVGFASGLVSMFCVSDWGE